MPFETSYEWKVEQTDEHGDIDGVNHFDTLQEAKAFGVEPDMVIVLVRDVGNDEEGLVDRQHAYFLPDGALPPAFDGGAKVPTRFHAEVKKNK